MRGNKKINVLYDERLVGTIAEISNRKKEERKCMNIHCLTD